MLVGQRATVHTHAHDNGRDRDTEPALACAAGAIRPRLGCPDQACFKCAAGMTVGGRNRQLSLAPLAGGPATWVKAAALPAPQAR